MSFVVNMTAPLPIGNGYFILILTREHFGS